MTESQYDVFITHAYEDDNHFVNQLALALMKRGLSVWYTGFELSTAGDFISDFETAEKNARYIIIVVSAGIMEHTAVMENLNKMLVKQGKNNRVLPVLHGVSVISIRKKYPEAARFYSISNRTSLTNVVRKIMHLVRGKRQYVRKKTGQKNAAYKKRGMKEKRIVAGTGFITLGGTGN